MERGLAESRAKAQAAIEAGGVRVNGVVIEKPSASIAENAALDVTPAHPWVSRGGVKLAFALDHFGVDPAGSVCLDVGSSTGGFTHVLLHRGAEHVTAVDVGRDQMHARLRDDPRVTILENTDARTLTSARLPQPPDLVVCDASFIALSQILPVPLGLAAHAADALVLIKPQFEAGKETQRDKRGHLPDAVAHDVAGNVADALNGLADFRLAGFVASPIRGGEGALEWLAHLRRP